MGDCPDGKGKPPKECRGQMFPGIPDHTPGTQSEDAADCHISGALS